MCIHQGTCACVPDWELVYILHIYVLLFEDLETCVCMSPDLCPGMSSWPDFPRNMADLTRLLAWVRSLTAFSFLRSFASRDSGSSGSLSPYVSV